MRNLFRVLWGCRRLLLLLARLDSRWPLKQKSSGWNWAVFIWSFFLTFSEKSPPPQLLAASLTFRPAEPLETMLAAGRCLRWIKLLILVQCQPLLKTGVKSTGFRFFFFTISLKELLFLSFMECKRPMSSQNVADRLKVGGGVWGGGWCILLGTRVQVYSKVCLWMRGQEVHSGGNWNVGRQKGRNQYLSFGGSYEMAFTC